MENKMTQAKEEQHNQENEMHYFEIEQYCGASGYFKAKTDSPDFDRSVQFVMDYWFDDDSEYEESDFSYMYERTAEEMRECLECDALWLDDDELDAWWDYVPELIC